jgi:homocysteine S-methyltransferase
VWVVDGGLATELEKRGYNIADDPLWSARLLYSDPQAILEVHKSYLESGADIIITASYQASVDGFCQELGLTRHEALDLIGRSVAIAKEAQQLYSQRQRSEGVVKGRGLPLVAGSVGPYGACQHDGSEYTGDYVDHMTKEDLKAWHRPRVSALLSSGVDLLACETLPAVEEGVALTELLQEEFPLARAWISFS